MRFVLIGATGFIGPSVARELIRAGHEVTLFHRGRCEPAEFSAVPHIHGDRNRLNEFKDRLRRVSPEVVIDFALSSARQASQVVDTFRGFAARVVALSSQDVYRAFEILHRIDFGPLQELPLTEDSELRQKLNAYPADGLKMLQQVFAWLDDEYDKISVERTLMHHDDLPATILRLPMVYGPGDPLHRLYPILKRIDDGRPAILLEDSAARFRAPRGYVENVAAAIVLAAASEQAAGRTYNIAEPEALSEIDWTRQVGEAAGWHGRVLSLSPERIPAHLKLPFNMDQHWVVGSERIRRELAYAEPVPRDVALRRTIEWERAHPPREVDPNQFDYAAEDAALAAIAA